MTDIFNDRHVFEIKGVMESLVLVWVRNHEDGGVWYEYLNKERVEANPGLVKCVNQTPAGGTFGLVAMHVFRIRACSCKNVF